MTGPTMTMKDDCWYNTAELAQHSWTCGHCGVLAGGSRGYYLRPEHTPQLIRPGPEVPRIFICTGCNRPTYFEGSKQMPGVAYGKPVNNLPADLDGIYTEARNCMAVSAFTPAVLAARTILMHVAVDIGAAENKNFEFYVNYLVDNHYVPPNSKGWVDRIRKKGNDATHKLPLMTRDDAEQVLRFLEMILICQYEYATEVPPP